MTTCTYNIGGSDGPDRECGRPAICKWVRLSDQNVRVVTCERHEKVVARALGMGIPVSEPSYRREEVQG